MEDGKVARLGDAEALLGEIGDVEVFEYRDALITPGFIDTHIHFPQTGMIASYGEQLLDWLNTYTFPTERQFSDQAHADQVAEIFLQELLRNGTTTALVFGSVHRQSVESFRGRPAPGPAPDRRQGDDGPQRARLPDRSPPRAATATARR